MLEALLDAIPDSEDISIRYAHERQHPAQLSALQLQPRSATVRVFVLLVAHPGQRKLTPNVEL